MNTVSACYPRPQVCTRGLGSCYGGSNAPPPPLGPGFLVLVCLTIEVFHSFGEDTPRGGHSQTNVLPTRVQTPQKWTLNGVLRHIKFAPLNGVTPVKHNLNGVIVGVTYPKWRTL